MSSSQNNNNNSNSNVFSKNDLASLVSFQSHHQSTTNGSSRASSKGVANAQNNPHSADISHLGSSETALLLRQQQQNNKKQNSNVSRYRAESKNKKLMHHQQIEILAGMTAAVHGTDHTDFGVSEPHSENLKPVIKAHEHIEKEHDDDDDDDDDDENFVQRKKIQPQVIRRGQRTGKDESSEQEDSDASGGSVRRRRAHERRRDRKASGAESSSSSESSSDDDSSDSEDEEDVDARRSRLRARVLAHRKIQDEIPLDSDKKTLQSQQAEPTSKKVPSPTNRTRKQSETSSSSEGSSSCDDSSSEEETSSSEENDNPQIAKPLFVPRHKRGTIKDANVKAAEEEQLQKKKEEQKKKRTLQSRAILAEMLSNEAKNKSNDNDLSNNNSDDEGGGTLMPPPSDDDDYENETEALKQRDAWQVRELLRILHTFEAIQEEERAAKELEFRRGLSDAEIMALERKERHNRGPSERKAGKEKGMYLQRYFHRGAFYLDEDSLKNDPNDVRNRAKEYALAATGEDKIDKRNLPKVMQVKKFGFAGQSTKYKGLKHEDTTERGRTYIPLKRQKRT